MTNSTGSQLADLMVRPIALKKVMRPEQENRAYKIIENKIEDSDSVKVFP